MAEEKAIFAAGCFWGVQHQMQRIDGVLSTEVGYTGGDEANPTYPEVKAHRTHHVEAIEVTYDADRVIISRFAACFLRYTTRLKPMALDPTWVRNTAARFSMSTSGSALWLRL